MCGKCKYSYYLKDKFFSGWKYLELKFVWKKNKLKRERDKMNIIIKKYMFLLVCMTSVWIPTTCTYSFTHSTFWWILCYLMSQPDGKYTNFPTLALHYLYVILKTNKLPNKKKIKKFTTTFLFSCRIIITIINHYYYYVIIWTFFN